METAVKWCKQSAWPLATSIPNWLRYKANSGNGYHWKEGDETYSAWYDAAVTMTNDLGATTSGLARQEQPTDLSGACITCGSQNRSDAQFCSDCGTKLNRDPNAVLTALASRVAELERNASRSPSHTHQWNWAKLDQGERWIVWWGVFWRGLVVYLGFVVLILIIQAGSR